MTPAAWIILCVAMIDLCFYVSAFRRISDLESNIAKMRTVQLLTLQSIRLVIAEGDDKKLELIRLRGMLEESASV